MVNALTDERRGVHPRSSLPHIETMWGTHFPLLGGFADRSRFGFRALGRLFAIAFDLPVDDPNIIAGRLAERAAALDKAIVIHLRFRVTGGIAGLAEVARDRGLAHANVDLREITRGRRDVAAREGKRQPNGDQ